MAIASKKHRLTSRDDIELCVVLKFRVGLKLSAVENIKTNSQTPEDSVHGTELEINLLGVSLLLQPAI